MSTIRKRIRLKGTPQEPSFSDQIKALSGKYCLAGILKIQSDQVAIELEGTKEKIGDFLEQLGRETSSPELLVDMTLEDMTVKGDTIFHISQGEKHYSPDNVDIQIVKINRELPCILGLGAELESRSCLTKGNAVYLSPRLGSLLEPETIQNFREQLTDLKEHAEVQPDLLAHDLHPDYHSTRYAIGIQEIPTIGVQHSQAHIASCMADTGHFGDVIGVVFDATCLSDEGHYWGGDFLAGSLSGFQRMAHIRAVPLPGNQRAAMEPWRMAYSWMDAAEGDGLYGRKIDLHGRINAAKYRLVVEAMRRNKNSPLTTSVERLLDGFAAILSLRDNSLHEGQAAEELASLQTAEETIPYPTSTYEDDQGMVILDPAEMVLGVLHDLEKKQDRAYIANRIFETLAFMVFIGCDHVRKKTGINTVALTGRVFRNPLLVKRAAGLLENIDFQVLTHKRFGAGDDGICVGQAVIGAASGMTG